MGKEKSITSRVALPQQECRLCMILIEIIIESTVGKMWKLSPSHRTCLGINDHLTCSALSHYAWMCTHKDGLCSSLFKLNNIIYNVPTLAIHRLNFNFIMKPKRKKKEMILSEPTVIYKRPLFVACRRRSFKHIFLYFQITQNLFYNISCFSLNFNIT